MTEANSVTRANDIAHVEGNTLTLRIGDYVLSLKIEGPEAKPSGRLQLGAGQTLFDLVLDASDDINKQNCPICGGNNIVKHEAQSFFEMLFGGAGGT